MVKSKFISLVATKAAPLSHKDIEFVVNSLLDIMKQAVLDGEGIEIRGFGSMHRRYRNPRLARNPKTGDKVMVSGRFSLHFTPAKALRERVNRGALALLQQED